MKINKTITNNEEIKLSYEQPALEKYGTMRELTFQQSGSDEPTNDGSDIGDSDDPDDVKD